MPKRSRWPTTAFTASNTKIVRIFNTYGPRMRLRDGRAVPAFMSQALLNEDVTIFGDGTQTRSFCYVTDLVDGLLRLMESDTNDPVNIGNPHEVTIEEIARTIIRLVGSTSKIVYRPLPVDDPEERRPDITRARTILGWEPKVGLEEGLLKTIDYFKGRRSLPAPAAGCSNRPPPSHQLPMPVVARSTSTDLPPRTRLSYPLSTAYHRS